jgi:DNA-directed RNA polymerase specialized sigma24 family protein
MASAEQKRNLTDLVLRAKSHQRWHGGNDNPALGEAILKVEKLLLPWVRSQLDAEHDAENMVAEAGAEMFVSFASFRGVTGAEFYGWMKTILEHAIAKIARLREALEKGGLRRTTSLDRDGRAARLAELLVSPEDSPEQAAIIRENKVNVRRALRTLPCEELRVVRLRTDDISFREIAGSFQRSLRWVQDTWDSAVQHLRTAIVKSRKRSRARQAA